MKPVIFDGTASDSHFTSEVVKLDLSLSSTLNWEISPPKKRVFWELDLGLFDRLAFPLTSESQLKTLGLGLQHFSDTLLKKHETDGVFLWRGSLNFEGAAPFDSPFDRRDVVLDFVEQLSYFLPEETPVYLLLDARDVADPLQQMLLADPGKRGRVGFALRGMRVPTRDMIWQESFSGSAATGYIGTKAMTFSDEPKRALFLPQELKEPKQLLALYERLEKEKIPYRLVGEESFTGEWDGLDELFVIESELSPLARRKLKAFEAAAGVVKNIG